MAARDRQGRLTPREWALSILLHAVVLGLLIWLTPARQVLTALTENKPPPPVPQPAYQDPTQVKEVVQAISEEQADAARDKVARLIDLEKKLDELTKARLDTYNKQAETISKDAAPKTLDQLAQIPPEQGAASESQNDLRQQVQNLLSHVADPTPDQTATQQTRDKISALGPAIVLNQTKIQDDQAKALQLVHFLGQDSTAAAAQQKANEAQTAAAASQKTALEAQSHLLSSLSPLRGQTAEVNRTKDNVAQTQAKIDATKQALAQEQPATDSTKSSFDAATATLNQARSTADADKTPESKQARNDAQTAMRTAENAYNKAKNVQNNDEHKLKSLTDQIQKQQQHLQQVNDTLTATQTKIAQLQSQYQTDEDTSTNDQLNAGKLQADAINQLNSVAASPGGAPAAATAPAALDTKDEPDPSTLAGKDFGQLYAIAGQVGDRISDKYKVYRAMELASIQEQTLDDALKETQVAKPDRQQLDATLLSAQGATQDFAAYKAEVIKGKEQISAMVDLSSDMVAVAEAQKDVGSGDAKLEEDHYDQMTSAALADDNVAGKDLTGLTGGAGAPGAAGISAESSIPGDQNVGEPDNSPRSVQTVPELPTMDENNPTGVATRKINASGPNYNKWLYVDSWYLIGPFSDEGRVNLDTKFPPESIIDLDAVYPGKGGRPLRWVFTQWGSPHLRPDHDIEDAPAIYYAYTEIQFDQPEDLWVATGTDDKGTMWLNDVMVWNSNDNLKAWRPDEGYRKVHFNQGRNRILYRIENGQIFAAFSLMISSTK